MPDFQWRCTELSHHFHSILCKKVPSALLGGFAICFEAAQDAMRSFKASPTHLFYGFRRLDEISWNLRELCRAPSNVVFRHFWRQARGQRYEQKKRGLRVLPRVFLPHTDDLRFQHNAFKFETFRLRYNLKLSERQKDLQSPTYDDSKDFPKAPLGRISKHESPLMSEGLYVPSFLLRGDCEVGLYFTR